MLMRWKQGRDGSRSRASGSEPVRSHAATRPRTKATATLGCSEIFDDRDLIDALEHELPKNRPLRRSLSLVVLGIDHLPPSTGDVVLRQVAELVRERSREIDRIARYNGDQLAIILPGRDPDSAEGFAETLRTAIEHHRFEPDGRHVTASLGVAVLPLYVAGGAELLADASFRLRRAIRLGGNQVVCEDGDECLILRRHLPNAPARDARRARLVVVHGTELGRKYDLEKRETTIGRTADSEILVNDEAVSRIHATITVDDTGVMLRDEGSKHGALVNGVVVHDARLANGDIISVGHHRFKLLLGNDIESMYHEEIYRLSTVDGLTQVFNERYFTETLARELARARRYDRPLALVMLDIDGFGACNDSFGRHAGDHLLQQLAVLVRDGSRRVDVVARHGGDELAMILPELELDAAMKHAETLCEAVEQARFEFEGRPIPITVSLGVAVLAPVTADADELVRIAAARLARAKALGGHRVVAADAQPEPADVGPPGASP